MRRTLLAEPCPPHVAEATRSKPRLGFLGAGWIGRSRLEVIARSGLAEIAAIADPQRGLAEEAARLAPGAAVLESLDDLFAAGVDGIVIATPSAMHAGQSLAALQRGLAVFCQKPLGRNARETRRVIDAARSANRLLGVDLSYRFVTAVRKIHDLCRNGELGDIHAVDLTFHNAYGPDKPWFYDRRLAGGGCVIDLGIHLVDLALWSLGFPRLANVTSRLFARGKPLADGEVEDFAEARLDLETGASVRLACSWKLPAGCDAIITGSFYGSKGGAAFRNVDGSFYDFIGEHFRGTKRERLAEPPDAWSGRAAVHWLQQLAAGRRFDPEVAQLAPVAEALDAIYDNSAPLRQTSFRNGSGSAGFAVTEEPCAAKAPLA